MNRALRLFGLSLALLCAPAFGQTAALVDDLQPFDGINPGSDPRFLFELAGRAVFRTSSFGAIGYRLWSSDGTAEGTEEIPGLVDPRLAGRLLGLGLLVDLDRSQPRPSSGKTPIPPTAPPTLQLALSDGTAAGTRRFLPGFVIYRAAEQLRDGLFYFFASRPGEEMALWVTDGGGPRRVAALGARDVGPATVVADGRPGGRLFFLASDEPIPLCNGHDDGPECEELFRWRLWTSDGTAHGTRHLPVSAQGRPDERPLAIHGLHGDGVYVSARDEVTDTTELYFTRGAAATTVRLATYRTEPGLEASPRFAELAGKSAFYAHGRHAGGELWQTDATPEGTRRISELEGESPFFGPVTPPPVATRDGRIVFLANDPELGLQLFSTDGRPASTTRLTDSLGPVAAPVGFDGKVFFVAVDGSGSDLWVTDGTRAGTRLVFEAGIQGFVAADPLLLASDRFLFSVGTAAESALWSLEPGDAAPRRLARFAPPDSSSLFDPLFVGGGVRLGDRFVFAADDGTHGIEPWTVDLSSATGSQRLVTDLELGEGPSSFPVGLTRLGERALFLACQGTEVALWSATGRAGETRRLQTLARPCESLFWEPPLRITVAGGRAYYDHNGDSQSGQVWVSDGTPEGTFELTAFEPTPPYGRSLSRITAWGEEALFARLTSNGTEEVSWELWATRGSVESTRRLFTVGPDAQWGLEPFGTPDRFYFVKSSFELAVELYVSDGTAAGTRRLLSGSAAPFGIGDLELTRLGEHDYFRWADTLWRTDGTAEGTESLAGYFTGTLGRDPFGLTAWNGAVYLFCESRLTGESGLWRTDGTAAGTRLLRDLGYVSSPAREPLVPFAGELFFAIFAGDGAGSGGYDLYSTDGTVAGTSPLGVDFGARASLFGELVPFGDRMYFAAHAGRDGSDAELWATDGTAAGTGVAQDIRPGDRSSDPAELLVLPDYLLFSANDGMTGRELWSLPALANGCRPSATALCLLSGRIRAEVVAQDPTGRQSFGFASPLTSRTGAFGFSAAGDLDLFVKVLDGTSVDGRGWVFVGSLADAGFVLTLTDTETGATRRYVNFEGGMASFADTAAFDFRRGLAQGELALPEPRRLESRSEPAAKAGVACAPAAERLCLLDGRFAVEIAWAGTAGGGPASMRPERDGVGLFWFFEPENLEGAVAMVDDRASGHVALFFTGLTDLELRIEVTDTQTGRRRTYFKPLGTFAAFADLGW